MLNHKPTINTLPLQKNDIPGIDFTPSGEACVVIPVFCMWEDQERLRTFIRLASWALNAWIENTDVVDRDVPVYIYVDQSCPPDALSELAKNCIPRDRIVVGTKGLRGLAQCMSPVFDENFSGYEYLIIPDSDVFPLRTPDSTRDDGIPIIEIVQSKCEGKIGAEIAKVSEHPIRSHKASGHWWWSSYNPETFPRAKKTYQQRYDIWMKALQGVVADDIVGLYRDGGYLFVNAGMRVFSRPILDEYTVTMDKLLTGIFNDELTMSLMEHIVPGGCVYDLGDDLSMTDPYKVFWDKSVMVHWIYEFDSICKNMITGDTHVFSDLYGDIPPGR